MGAPSASTGCSTSAAESIAQNVPWYSVPSGTCHHHRPRSGLRPRVGLVATGEPEQHRPVGIDAFATPTIAGTAQDRRHLLRLDAFDPPAGKRHRARGLWIKRLAGRVDGPWTIAPRTVTIRRHRTFQLERRAGLPTYAGCGSSPPARGGAAPFLGPTATPRSGRRGGACGARSLRRRLPTRPVQRHRSHSRKRYVAR